jgi:hypothetical protein
VPAWRITGQLYLFTVITVRFPPTPILPMNVCVYRALQNFRNSTVSFRTVVLSAVGEGRFFDQTSMVSKPTPVSFTKILTPTGHKIFVC